MKGTDLITYKDVMFLLGCGQCKAYEIIKGLREESKYDEFAYKNHITGLVIPSKLFIKKYPNFKNDICLMKQKKMC